jgi:hypothetical protein
MEVERESVMAWPQQADTMAGRVKIPGTTNRHRLMIYCGLALLILLGGGTFYDIRSDHFREPARVFLESMFDRKVELGEASFNLLGRVTIRDVKIYNPPGYANELFVHAPIVRFTLGMTGGETSAFRPTRIVMTRPEFHWERPLALPWNSENLWRKKAPRHDHPTFTLPVSIRGAEVTFTDSRVGRNGIRLAFHEVDVQFTVMSDGSEIKNILSAQDVRAPGGGEGRFDLVVSSHPNSHRSTTTLTLREIDILPLKPYYEFLNLFTFTAGRGSGLYRMETESGVFSTEADFHVEDADVKHERSGREFQDITTHIRYESRIADTRIAIRDLRIDWLKSRVTGGGTFSNRYSPDTEIDFQLSATDARAEDLAFLLCDPHFEARGPLRGRCHFFTDGAGGGTRSRYEVEATLDAADARYGQLITKPPGVPLRIALDGRSGARPDRIRVSLAGSTGELTPRDKTGWRLVMKSLSGADVRAHVVPIGAMPDLALEGPIHATLDLHGGGRIAGEVDLTPTAIRSGTDFLKPAGDIALLDIAGTMTREGVSAENWTARLGKSRLSLQGRWSPETVDYELGIVEMPWADANRYFPKLTEKLTNQLRLGGAAGGRIRVRSPESGTTGLRLNARFDLGRSDIEIAGFGRKKRGVPSALEIEGVLQPGSIAVSKGSLQVESTDLAINGDFAAGACNLTVRGRATGFDGLRTILASQFWPALKSVESAGNIDVNATIASRGDELRVATELNATDALLAYADTWIKPLGETFRVRSILSSSPAGTAIERLEFTQGTSTLLCEGRIGGGRPAPIAGTVRADIDVPVFLKRAKGLERMIVDRRRASDALVLIADDRDRAALTWQLSGSIDEPRMALVMDQIMSRVIANAISRQLRAITSIITAPVRIGTGIVRDALSEETPPHGDTGARR